MPDESARAAILARIRGALAEPLPLPEKPDFTAPVHPTLPAEDLTVVFAVNFQRIGGEFYYCESLAHLAAQLASFRAKQPTLAPPYVWEPALQQLLSAAKVPFRAGEDDFRENADLGLTSCEALIARAGSVLVSAATASGRRLSIYPDQHLVLARPGQAVAGADAPAPRNPVFRAAVAVRPAPHECGREWRRGQIRRA